MVWIGIEGGRAVIPVSSDELQELGRPNARCHVDTPNVLASVCAVGGHRLTHARRRPIEASAARRKPVARSVGPITRPPGNREIPDVLRLFTPQHGIHKRSDRDVTKSLLLEEHGELVWQRS